MKYSLIAATLLTLAVTAGKARATTTPTPIHVDCTSGATISDSIGAGICSEARDSFANSPRYTLTKQNDPNHYEVHILSVAVSFARSAPIGSAVAYNLTFKGVGGELFYDDGVLLCSEKNTCSKDIMAAVDSTIAKVAQ